MATEYTDSDEIWQVNRYIRSPAKFYLNRYILSCGLYSSVLDFAMIGQWGRKRRTSIFAKLVKFVGFSAPYIGPHYLSITVKYGVVQYILGPLSCQI